MSIEHSHEYKMGYDCGINGANTTNCNVSLFSTKEKMKEWEKGKNAAAKRKIVVYELPEKSNAK